MHWKNNRAIIVLTAVALLACYAPILRGMADQWRTDDDMSHGFAVPIIVLWIVWRERDHWCKLPATPSLWGPVVLTIAAGLHVIAAIGAGLFAGSLAFLLSIAGVVLCLRGVPLLRAWAFPLLLSLFMLPKLAIVYNQSTLPLQLLASRLAAGILTFAGAGIIREGNILNVAGHRVAAAEACNGIRYLLPLGFMALVFAYWSDRKPWMRPALLAAAIPLAILANALRVAAAAWVPALDAGTPHAVLGCVLFMACLASLVVLRRAFDAVYRYCHA